MLRCYSSELLKFICLHSRTNYVMKVVEFKLATDAVFKKVVNAVLAVSKKMLKAWLRIQINIMVFPLCFVYGGLKCAYQQYLGYDNEVETCVEPESSVIVGAVKKLRNSVILGISSVDSSMCNGKAHPVRSRCNSVSSLAVETSPVCVTNNVEESENPNETSTDENKSEAPKVAHLSMSAFTGNDLMWDMPIIAQKSKYFAKCLREGNPEKIAAARKALIDHPTNNPMPKTRREYDRLMEEARNGPPISVEETVHKSKNSKTENANRFENSKSATSDLNVLKCKVGNKKVNFCFDGAECSGVREGVTKCHSDFHLTLQNKILRRRLATTNRKLEEVHKACSSLLHGICSLNDHFNRFTAMREKLVTLEIELDEGRKLLHEVEDDRNMMRSKLLALEKLIKEEEDFLDDVSCESGFDETENNGDSHDEL